MAPHHAGYAFGSGSEVMQKYLVEFHYGNSGRCGPVDPLSREDAIDEVERVRKEGGLFLNWPDLDRFVPWHAITEVTFFELVGTVHEEAQKTEEDAK